MAPTTTDGAITNCTPDSGADGQARTGLKKAKIRLLTSRDRVKKTSSPRLVSPPTTTSDAIEERPASMEPPSTTASGEHGCQNGHHGRDIDGQDTTNQGHIAQEDAASRNKFQSFLAQIRELPDEDNHADAMQAIIDWDPIVSRCRPYKVKHLGGSQLRIARRRLTSYKTLRGRTKICIYTPPALRRKTQYPPHCCPPDCYDHWECFSAKIDWDAAP